MHLIQRYLVHNGRLWGSTEWHIAECDDGHNVLTPKNKTVNTFFQSDYFVNLKQLRVQISLKSWLMALLRSSSEAPGFFLILLIATSWGFHLPLYTVPYPPSPILYLTDTNLYRKRETSQLQIQIQFLTWYPSCWWPQQAQRGRPLAPIQSWSWSWPCSFRPGWRLSCQTFLLEVFHVKCISFIHSYMI